MTQELPPTNQSVEAGSEQKQDASKKAQFRKIAMSNQTGADGTVFAKSGTAFESDELSINSVPVENNNYVQQLGQKSSMPGSESGGLGQLYNLDQMAMAHFSTPQSFSLTDGSETSATSGAATNEPLQLQGEPVTSARSDTARTSSTATESAASDSSSVDSKSKTSSSSQTTQQKKQELQKDTDKLKADEKALLSNSKDSAALSDLNRDEHTLHTDMLADVKDAVSFDDLKHLLEPEHAELKDIATGLWDDEDLDLKEQARQTTAYYPLSPYQHQFKSAPPPPPPPPPGGGQTFSNLESQTWKQNTNDKGKDGIGGAGIDPKIQESYKDGVLSYTSTGGAWDDTLISEKSVYKNPSDNTFTLSYDMNDSLATRGSENASEHDMVITGANGYQAQAASQFVFKDGYVEFDTSKMVNPGKNEWVEAAKIPLSELPAGAWNDVSMTVKLVGNNLYEYTGLTINGKNIALNPDATTFNMQPEDWTKDSVITQLQEDLNSKGGTISQQYKDISVTASQT